MRPAARIKTPTVRRLSPSGSMAEMAAKDAIVLRAIGRPVDCSVRVPGSKSLTNRALFAAALAEGLSTLRGVLNAEDTRLMADALRELGAEIRADGSEGLCIRGCGGYWRAAEADLYAGNAGTVLRFLTAGCAIGNGRYRLDGSARMRQRPIRDLVDALRDLGARIGYEGEEGHCPFTIQAAGLRGGQVVFERPISSQFISALLLAAPRAMNDVMIRIEGALPSAPFVRMTTDLMQAFGVDVVEDDRRVYIVPAMQPYRACEYQVEPDATAASYFFAAAAVTGGRVTIDGLGASSCQGDLGFVRVLERMGCIVEQELHSTTVRGPADGVLRGLDEDLSDMPDVAQTLAVVACFASGPTTIRGLATLRVKETDRLEALATELTRMGMRVDARADELRIDPGVARAVRIETYDDHRMAMSFAVAGLRTDGLTICDPDCVAKTFPDFFTAWDKLSK